MGASGDMFMAALYELLPDKSVFHEKMESLNLPEVTLKYSESIKCGIKGTHISVIIDGHEDISDDVYSLDNHTHEHHHEHPSKDSNHHHSHTEESAHHHNHHHSHKHSGRRYGYTEILELIQNLNLTEKVKTDAVSIYKIIGEAEANVHGTSLDEIHFHEVGSIDAIVDVVGCCILVDILGVAEITASPVHVGFGMVRCEHGILPIPAPATAEILKNIPIYSGRIEGELCTPTGAALLKHFASDFGQMPPMIVKNIGYGMGTKDFEAANCLRAFLGDKTGDGSVSYPPENQDIVYEISCNLDDMTPEAVSAAFDILLENSALDVYSTPIMMKKNRPAVKLSCICTEETHENLTKLILRHTTTLGVRTAKYHRTILERTTETVNTKYGDIRVKKANCFGITKQKPEYDDIQKAAKKHNVPFGEIYDSIKARD